MESVMPKIIANRGVVTQINVFDARPGKEEALVALLKESAQSVRAVPGWMSASLHRSLDGKRVVNYAQCSDMAAWERVMAKLNAGGFIERNKALGVAHPGLYEVVYVLERRRGLFG
jgi:quinol monooxygenase YgiN